jgi:uncharacterized protein (DUF1330 family)
MSAYLIFMRDKSLDEHELATYSKEVLATLAGEVKVLALHGSHEDMEGASTEGAVILEFPGIEGARTDSGLTSAMAMSPIARLNARSTAACDRKRIPKECL